MANGKPVIYVVDDESIYTDILEALLCERYKVLCFPDGERALSALDDSSTADPDLILLDVLMPGLNGYEVCKHIRGMKQYQHLPILFLTVKDDIQDELKGFEVGASDYIAKPLNPAIVMARVKAQLIQADYQVQLESEVAQRTQEIQRTQDIAIYCMASLAETRDSETGNHIRRTQHYIKVLTEELRQHPEYRDALTDEHATLIFKSAPLHDIGKVGVPDVILKKPGPLNDDEWEQMRKHPRLGLDAIRGAEEALGTTQFLDVAKEIAHTHHEKWDGSGYPQGLRGKAIPVSGRLMALADVYDALTHKRVYKDAFPHAEAVAWILSQSGTHFDPAMVAAFEARQQDFLEITQRFPDEA